jgi:integrase
MPLTELACRNAKPADKVIKLSDGGGLQLWIRTSGTKNWHYAYRFDGKQRSLVLGTYPNMKLAEAREKREDAKRQLRLGIDPAIRNRASTEAGDIFETAARRWHTTQAPRWSEKHAANVLARLEHDVFPQIGGRHINALEPPDILELVRKVEKRGAIDVAKRVHQHIGQIYRFAIAEGIALRDPSADIAGALAPKPKTRHNPILRELDLPEFMAKLDAYTGDVLTLYALRLTLLTLVRTSETRFARWSEFYDLDGRNPLWRIPAERMKMDREHVVPLSKQAVEVIQSVRQVTGKFEYLFTAPTRSDVISENTMLYALYRMGYHSRLTVHGLRGTASTILNEHQWNRDWIERQLAHDEKNEVRGAYNAAEYLPGRRQMLQWWADLISGYKVAKAQITGPET